MYTESLEHFPFEEAILDFDKKLWSNYRIALPLSVFDKLDDQFAIVIGAGRYFLLDQELNSSPLPILNDIQSADVEEELVEVNIPLVDPLKLQANLFSIAALYNDDEMLEAESFNTTYTALQRLQEHLVFLIMSQGVDEYRVSTISHTAGNISLKAGDAMTYLNDPEYANIKEELMPILENAAANLSYLIDKINSLSDEQTFASLEIINRSLAHFVQLETDINFNIVGGFDNSLYRSLLSADLIQLNLDEIISNIITHSDATKVEISCINSKDMIGFVLRDNGVGINSDKLMQLQKKLSQNADAIPAQGNHIGGTGFLRIRRAGFGVDLQNDLDDDGNIKGFITTLKIPIYAE